MDATTDSDTLQTLDLELDETRAAVLKTQRTIDVESRRAQKPHSCVYCDRPIEVGMPYVRIVLVTAADVKDGILQVVKFHKEKTDCNAKR